MEKPGPDYVRVLAVLRKQKKQQWLIDLAMNLVNNEAPRHIAANDAGLPSEFTVDRSFYAVAMGPWEPDTLDYERETLSPDQASLSMLLPENSEYFTIRGFVKADSFGSVPSYIRGKAGESDLKLYSDPGTGTSLLCPNDGPLG